MAGRSRDLREIEAFLKALISSVAVEQGQEEVANEAERRLRKVKSVLARGGSRKELIEALASFARTFTIN